MAEIYFSASAITNGWAFYVGDDRGQMKVIPLDPRYGQILAWNFT